MRTIEAHVFARGFAYRFGGDEYVLLLPNNDLKSGLALLHVIRREVSGLEYEGINEKTTVSMGVCCIPPNCRYTDNQVLRFAEVAKNFAKQRGKDCIAKYPEDSFQEDSLAIDELS